MKKLFFLAFCIGIFSTTAIAQKNLSMHECPSKNDSESCSLKFTQTPWKINFLTDKSSNSVMVKMNSSDSGETSSKTKTSCRIFNDKNWDCSGELTGDYNHMVQAVEKRVDGIYVNYFRNIIKGVDKTTNFYCAK
jgi:hypothetical protein